MQAQPDPRFRKRLPCDVRVGDTRYPGLVTNLSRSGLFVQTEARAATGQLVAVALGAPTVTPGIALRARVMWQRAVPAALRGTLTGGFGVAIEAAPEAYYAFLDAVARLSALPQRDAADEERARFRVRLQQIGSARSRTIEIEAVSEPMARHRALASAGRDWAVTGIERH